MDMLKIYAQAIADEVNAAAEILQAYNPDWTFKQCQDAALVDIALGHPPRPSIEVRVGLPKNPKGRVSSDSVWPLRRADGRTWAEAKGAE